jgi:hypothetical protein
VLVDENRRGGDHCSLISPRTGGAVASEYVELLTVGAVWDGVAERVDALTDRVLDELHHQDRLVREAGELVTDPNVERAVVVGRVDRALERIGGVFRAHGITRPHEPR